MLVTSHPMVPFVLKLTYRVDSFAHDSPRFHEDFRVYRAPLGVFPTYSAIPNHCFSHGYTNRLDENLGNRPIGKDYLSMNTMSSYEGFHGGTSIAGWCIRENPMKLDDLGVALFQEPPLCPQVSAHPAA